MCFIMHTCKLCRCCCLQIIHCVTISRKKKSLHFFAALTNYCCFLKCWKLPKIPKCLRWQWQVWPYNLVAVVNQVSLNLRSLKFLLTLTFSYAVEMLILILVADFVPAKWGKWGKLKSPWVDIKSFWTPKPPPNLNSDWCSHSRFYLYCYVI